MCELTIIRKMWLCDSIPRKIMCVRNSALGVGLIELKTEIDYLVIKTHTENRREKV